MEELGQGSRTGAKLFVPGVAQTLDAPGNLSQSPSSGLSELPLSRHVAGWGSLKDAQVIAMCYKVWELQWVPGCLSTWAGLFT